ncbi:hypothetical protein GQ53DRAFT_140523 [Thozetella sp. PMI_491]|nr:hypothetical protein GQ53DRAFT_140523 [Thozetella sp. PMI_491]
MPVRRWACIWFTDTTSSRLVRLAFILDVKHCILHGGEPTMVPFDLNIKLYGSEDAWYATSASEWAHLFALNAKDSFYFIDFLKMLWNPRAKTLKSEKLPRGSNIALYGIVSVARELCRRNDLRFLDQSGDSLMSLGKTVSHSLANWELLWRKVAIPSGLTSNFLWRDCTCMLNLAYTLYEIGPVDLQTVAGKDMIEGKKRVAADYVRSRRKMSRWVKEDRAWLGVSRNNPLALPQSSHMNLASLTVL